MNDPIENRRHPRVPINWPAILISPQGPIKGETGNLSVGGALILCPEAPDLEDEFQVILKSSEDHEISVTCERAWSSDFSANGAMLCGMGVRFINLSTTDHEIIASQVSEYLL